MDIRTLVFNLKDIIYNYNEIAANLTNACHRDGTHYRVSGVCQNYDTVFFPFENQPPGNFVRYVIAPFTGITDAHIKADIFTRWGSGYSTKGLIRLPESYLGLFEIQTKQQ